VKVTIDEKKKIMTIEMPLQEARPSGSGKTMVVASTNGNVDSGATVNGKPVKIGINAYYKPDAA